MIDPSTITVGIAFAFGCLNFLLATISKVQEKGRDVVEYKQRLQAYKLQLGTCQTAIEGWTHLWGGYSENTYITFWGQDAFYHISNSLEIAQLLSTQIRRQIEGLSGVPASSAQALGVRDRPTGADRRLGAQMIVFVKDRSSRVLKFGEEQVLRRILFALFRNDELREMFGRLDRVVADLETLSRDQYNLLRGHDRTSYVSREAVDRASRVESFIETLTTFATSLFESKNGTDINRAWILELRLPDNEGNSKFCDSTYEINLDFTLSDSGAAQNMSSKRVRIRYRLTDDPIAAASNALSDIAS